MKRCKIEITVIIPDRTPMAEAVAKIEDTDQLAGFELDALDVLWQDEDEPDEDELEAARLERLGYEQDMRAALRL